MSITPTVEAAVSLLLTQAVSHHHAGDLSEAESLYRRILAREPAQADAHHNLGILALQTGHAPAALTHFQAALGADPRQRQFWLSCIGALRQLGQHQAAAEMLTQARLCGLDGKDCGGLAAQPQSTPGGGGPPAKKVKLRGKHKQRRAAEQIAGPSPEVPSAQADELVRWMKEKHFEPAEKLARGLIARFPRSGFLWKVLGAALQEQGRRTEALQVKEHAATLLPDDAEIQNNLGNALLKLVRLEEAEVCYRRAVKLSPAYPEPWCSLGLVMQKRGQLEEADRLCRHALTLRPVYADASSNLGIVLQTLGRFGDAEACYRTALGIDPSHCHAWSNLGTALQKQGRLDEAADAYARSFELRPEYIDALANLAGCLHQQGRQAEAEQAHRLAIDRDREQLSIYTNFLFFLGHCGAVGPEQLFAEHLRFAERFETPLRAGWLPHSNSRDPDRVLRIGLISADFQQHAMASFIEPLLEGLAPDASLSLHAYANQTADDAVTQRLRRHFREWNPVYGLSDQAVADKIRADGIDILIDLCGHTGGGNPGVFMRKPAPIQCGWIGYLGTSGLRSMDYYLADPLFLPPGAEDRFFTEKIAYLPLVAPFRPVENAPPAAPLPAFERGHITFGSFSRMGKLSPAVAALWSQLLRATPGSRMVLGGMRPDGRNHELAGWFAAEGIASDRLDFVPSAGMAAYLALHGRIDICLDPFPFTGATTTCHAMWMGVPTLTLEGKTPAGRLGPALLRHAGLADFVAQDPEDYLAKGLRWANDLDALARLRQGMRAGVAASLLGRPNDFGRELSSLLRRLWGKWCDDAVEAMPGDPPFGEAGDISQGPLVSFQNGTAPAFLEAPGMPRRLGT